MAIQYCMVSVVTRNFIKLSMVFSISLELPSVYRYFDLFPCGSVSQLNQLSWKAWTAQYVRYTPIIVMNQCRELYNVVYSIIFCFVFVYFILALVWRLFEIQFIIYFQVQSYKFIPLVYQIASRMGSTKEGQGAQNFQV